MGKVVCVLFYFLITDKILYAQNFLPAKIITRNNYSMNGFVKEDQDWSLNHRIVFKKSYNDSSATTINADSVQSLKFENGRWLVRYKVWNSEKKDSISALLKNIISGKIEFISYSPQRNKETFFLIKGKKIMSLNQKTAQGLLNFLFQDCPSFKQKYKPNRSNRIEPTKIAIRNYNNCSGSSVNNTYYNSSQKYIGFNAGLQPWLIYGPQSNAGIRVSAIWGKYDPEIRSVSFEKMILLGYDNNSTNTEETLGGVQVRTSEVKNRYTLGLIPLIAKFKKDFPHSGFYARVGIGLVAVLELDEMKVQPNTYFNPEFSPTNFSAVPSILISAGYQIQMKNNNSINFEIGTYGYSIGYLFSKKNSRVRFSY